MAKREDLNQMIVLGSDKYDTIVVGTHPGMRVMMTPYLDDGFSPDGHSLEALGLLLWMAGHGLSLKNWRSLKTHQYPMTVGDIARRLNISARKLLSLLRKLKQADTGIEFISYHEILDVRLELEEAAKAIVAAPKQKTRNCGFVYFLRSSQGHTKIGKSVSVPQRVSEIMTHLPFDVELIHVIKCDNYTAAEHELHKHFSSKRLKGEWFNLSSQEILWLTSLADLPEGWKP